MERMKYTIAIVYIYLIILVLCLSVPKFKTSIILNQKILFTNKALLKMFFYLKQEM